LDTPIITTQRDELIIYRPEWEETLLKAKEMYGPWLACWLAFDCIFGKRRNEICKLKRKDIWIENNFLYVRFYVGKKRSKKGTIDRLPYTKKITLNHYAVHYILEYLKEYDEWRKESTKPTEYLFPSGHHRSENLTVRTKCKNGLGEDVVLEYHYKVERGYICGDEVYKKVKKVNPNIWLHLGRHSVGTAAAEHGASEYDVANILDVTTKIASKYVHHGTALTEEWSKRTG